MTSRSILIACSLTFLHACGGGGAIAAISEPELIPNPSGRVPLAAVIQFQSSADVQSTLEITDGEHSWEASFGPESAVDGNYAIPVVGMRPDREHDITLTMVSEGERSQSTFTHRTPSMSGDPRSVPPLKVLVSEPDRMEPGVLFLSVRRRALGRSHWLTDNQRRFSTDWGRLIALDPSGDVIWSFESEFRTAGIARLANGNILMHRTDFSTVEIDLLGNVVRQFYAEKRPFPPPENPDAIAIKGQQTLHHQPHEKPNGNFLAFSANGYLIEDWYTDEYDPDAPRADQMVMADTVVEITPEGDTVWSWNTMDYLDPFRIGYDTDWAYWPVRGFPDHMDWTHANGLSWDDSDDSVLVSLRNQSAILKIDYASKDIKWILGRHDDWPDYLQDKLLTPVGDLLWPGYQHNPRMTHAGTVILFDNRAHGATRPYEEPQPLEDAFSRGVEYEVDEEAMTVRQVWTSGDKQRPDSCFANAMSDAWRLPQTDNRLVIFAFCLPRMEGVSQDPRDETRRYVGDLPYGGRAVEYAGGDVVFQVEIKDEFDLQQWEMYGGFKSSGIYHDPSAIVAH